MTHLKLQKLQKGDYPISTSPKCQCAAELYHLFVIFVVLDVSLAVNLCINCSFLHLYLQFYYILTYYSKIAFLDCIHESFVLTVWWTKLATRQLFTAR